MKSTTLLLAIAAMASLDFTSAAQGFFTNGLPEPVAIGVVGNINCLSNRVATDSYDSTKTNLSTNAQYDPSKSSTNGNVASLQGQVNIGSGIIFGSLYLGTAATYSGTGMITGRVYTNSNIAFPDVALPPDASGWPTATPVVLYTYTTNRTLRHGIVTITIITNISSPVMDFTNSGNYTLNTDAYPIYVEPGVTVNLNVTSSTFSPTDLEIHGGVTNSGTAVLYLNGPTSVTIAGNSAIDASNVPRNLWYLGLPSLTSITYSGTSEFIGVIYAPEVALTLNGGGNNSGIQGSAIVGSITMNNRYNNFHFDESLGSPATIMPPTMGLQILAGYPLLNLSGMLGGNFVVEYSTDLSSTNWIILLSLTNLPVSPYEFLDPAGIDQPARFYRAFMQ